MRVQFSLLAVLLGAIVVSPACTPKIGDTCKVDVCGDKKTLLACKNERLLPVQCDGPKGCAMEGNTAHCDFSGNKPGTPCDDRFLGKRMCKDAKSVIGCTAGKYAVTSCGGPSGCTANSDADMFVKDCDTTVGKAGGDCDRAFTTKPACDETGKQTLECGKDNKWAALHFCRGPKGCVSSKGEITCDHSLANVGDPCMPPVQEICSPDGAAAMLCDGSKMFEKLCIGPKKCVTNADGIICDMLSPYDGSPCDTKGQKACQKPYEKDPGKLLECDGKKFTVSKRCGKECVFTRPNTYECK